MNTEYISYNDVIINSTEYTEKMIVKLSGKLDADSARSFIRSLPATNNKKDIELNCENLSFIDGSGMLVLSIFLTHIIKTGVNIWISNLSGQPLKLFQHLGLYDIYCKKNRIMRFRWISLWYSSIVKRFIDIVVSLFVITLCIIPGLILCILISLESSGLPIYTQQRMKKHNRETLNDLKKPDKNDTFTLYKFRTMFKDAEASTGAINASENDPRVTKIGGFLRKTRLDELPNFINVLLGDMSIVGPRADRLDILTSLETDFPVIYERCRFVKPGITGLAQIELKSDGSLPNQYHKLMDCVPDFDLDKPVNSFRFKMYYEAAYSLSLVSFISFLKLELWIMVRTPVVMFFKSNVI